MKVYVYSRVSTDKQTLEQQERKVKTWLDDNKLEAYKIISDEGVSGATSYKDRNLGKILLPELVEGDLLVVSEISRLGRSMNDVNNFVVNELKPRKIRLVIVEMHIDLNCGNIRAIDEMILFAFNFSAQVEKELIPARTKEAINVRKDRLAKDGSFISKKGNVCTHLGSQKGCDMTAAFSKSVEVRRNRARDNKNNRLFYGALTNYERSHGKITPNTNLNDFVTELNRLGAKTATGMEITYNRCRPMIVKTKKIYNMND